ncbi:MAG: TonB-dependent receptor [Caulobacteraceae bacterium]|nr:MAG: TonB-dependent receptor [Caulobacteraceae bacterium]
MTVSHRALLFGLGALGLWAAATPVVSAQETTAPTATEGDEIVVTGTRVQGRSRLDTVAPVDVITAEALGRAGTTEVSQALSYALPSFNFPRPAITDGTDTVRPATLRGLAPDQALVLVNSKRRHATALVNVNGSIGRGSSAVDLNTIPSGAIGSIEVLRDGASAQYGSDAIAGVLNVRLREARDGGAVTVTYGERHTTVETPTANPSGNSGSPAPNWTVPQDLKKREVSDGRTITTSGWVGLPLGEDGFLTISGEYKDAERTVRGAPDARQQYPLIAGAYDPREQTINRLNSAFGDPELEQYTLFANAGVDLGSAELYGWASYQDRDALSAGFWRRAVQTALPGTPPPASQNIISIYPDGFLPLIHPQITDYEAAGGLRFEAAGWDFDTSVVYGSNEIQFGVDNTLNASIGPTSKRSFDAGSLIYAQLVGNFSAVRSVPVSFLASPLNVAAGIEARRETYEIQAGEPDSYRQGGYQVEPGRVAVPGAQVFPGFQPINEVDEDRTAIGAYLDLEANVTDAFLLSGAVRVEDYSDFGSSVTGKVAARYDFNDTFALRGAVSTGFRAPSLQQSFFGSTATNFVNLPPLTPLQVLHVPATSSVATALGAKPLDAEESENFSLGAVARSGRFSATIDTYFIKIADRIVLSENLGAGSSATDAAIRAIVQAANPNVDAARFFINGVDTESFGVDIVLNYRLPTDNAGDWEFTVGANVNQTDITGLPAQPAGVLPVGVAPPTLFGRVAQMTLEDGQPKEKVTFSTNWDYGWFGATFRGTYYGAVVSPGGSPAGDINLGQKTLFDLEGRFDAGKGFQFALGAENLLDEYPDATPASINTSGATAFSSYSPFGFNGRYLYARATYSW